MRRRFFLTEPYDFVISERVHTLRKQNFPSVKESFCFLEEERGFFASLRMTKRGAAFVSFRIRKTRIHRFARNNKAQRS
jgi:hypothetical protein